MLSLGCATGGAADFTFDWREPVSAQHTESISLLRQGQFDRVVQLATAATLANPKDSSAYVLLALAHAGRGEVGKALAQGERAGAVEPWMAVEVYRKLAAAYTKMNRFYPATVALLRARGINGSVDAIHDLGSVYLAQGRLEKARAAFESILAVKPDHAALSRICFRLGDHASSGRYAKLWLASDPGNQGAQLLAASHELFAGNNDAALAGIRRLAVSPANLQVIGHYLALIALARDDFDGALQETGVVLKDFPKLREAKLISAMALQMKGRFSDARTQAETLLVANPGDAVAHLVVAAALIGEGRPAEAKLAFQKAEALLLELGPPFNDTFRVEKKWDARRAGRFAMVNFFLTEKLAPQAAGLAARVEATVPSGEPLFAILRARAESIAGNRQGAEKIHALVARSDRNVITPFLELAELAIRDGKVEALDGALDAGEKRQTGSVRFHVVAGELAYRGGRIDLAKRHFKRVIELAPNASIGHNQLAWTMAEKERNFADALPVAAAAMRLDPAGQSARDTLGWIHFELGRFEEAAKIYEPFFKTPPQDSTVLFHLASVAEKIGRKDRAADLLERALTLSGNFSAAPAAEAKLLSLWGTRSLP